MVTMEERISFLEGKMDSVANKEDLGDVREQIVGLQGEVRGQIAELRGEFRVELKAIRVLMVTTISVTGLALAALGIILRLIG